MFIDSRRCAPAAPMCGETGHGRARPEQPGARQSDPLRAFVGAEAWTGGGGNSRRVISGRVASFPPLSLFCCALVTST